MRTISTRAADVVLPAAAAVFSRNATTGSLTFVEVLKDGGAGVDGLSEANSVTISPDDKHVYVTGASDNAVAVFSRNATTGSLTFVQVLKDGDAGVDGLAFARSVTVSPDNQHVYATGISSVVVFSRNATTGSLTFVQVLKDGGAGVDGLSGASGVTISPNGQHVLIAGGLDNALALFTRNQTTGQLTFVETQKDNVGGVHGLDFVQSVTVSPDNRYIYTGGAGVDNAVAVFSTPGTSGGSQTVYLALILKQLPPTPMPTPTVTPSGQFEINGSWSGTTSLGTGIIFTIANREIASIAVNACGATFSETFFLDRPKVTGNTLLVETTGAFAFRVQGTFTSNSAASGTVTLDNNFCKANATWSASKR